MALAVSVLPPSHSCLKNQMTASLSTIMGSIGLSCFELASRVGVKLARSNSIWAWSNLLASFKAKPCKDEEPHSRVFFAWVHSTPKSKEEGTHPGSRLQQANPERAVGEAPALTPTKCGSLAASLWHTLHKCLVYKSSSKGWPAQRPQWHAEGLFPAAAHC